MPDRPPWRLIQQPHLWQLTQASRTTQDEHVSRGPADTAARFYEQMRRILSEQVEQAFQIPAWMVGDYPPTPRSPYTGCRRGCQTGQCTCVVEAPSE